MRTLVYHSLSTLAALNDLAPGLTNRIYPVGSLGVGDIPAEPDRPYIQYGFDTHTPYAEVREGGGPLRHIMRVFYYDDRGDYLRIDAIHKLVRQTIEGLTTQVSPTGVRCTDAMFLTLGGDLVDNVRSLNVKQATFRLVAR